MCGIEGISYDESYDDESMMMTNLIEPVFSHFYLILLILLIVWRRWKYSTPNIPHYFLSFEKRQSTVLNNFSSFFILRLLGLLLVANPLFSVYYSCSLIAIFIMIMPFLIGSPKCPIVLNVVKSYAVLFSL